MPTLMFALGLMLCALVFAKMQDRSSSRVADLGGMSRQWVAAHHAAEPASSI